MSQINNISKIPFKVSARTARLIGRENIATSRGAIIELVKNGYDADGKASLIYFDNEFSSVHNKITAIYFNRLLEKIQQHYFHLIKKVLKDEEKIKVEEEKLDLINLLSESYIKNKDNTYVLNLKIADESYNKLKNYLSKLACLYIVDNGEGMTADVIINHWMVIGTDNKHDNFITKSGRVKTGAKGIGRFALDKLGSVCEMITIYNPDSYLENQSFEADGYIWRVNWEDFEGGFKTIDKVGAELEELKEIELEQFIEQLIPSKIRSKLEKGVVFKYGTILKISNLREVWNEYYIDQVYSDLEILVPPEETGGFQIYLFSSNEPDRYGLIPSVVCDDFDYKIIARANEQQEVEIKIIRSEYDVDKIPIDFFQRKRMLKYPYRVEDFRKKEWALKMTFAQLIPGYKELDTDLIFETIGKFEFVFYYLKRSKSPESQKFFHKNNLFNFRKGDPSQFNRQSVPLKQHNNFVHIEWD